MNLTNLQIYYVEYNAYDKIFKLLASTHKPTDEQRYYLVSLGDAYIQTFNINHFDGLAEIVNRLQKQAGR